MSLYKKGNLEQGVSHVNMKAEIGAICLQAKEVQSAPKAPEGRQETWNRFSVTDFRRN